MTDREWNALPAELAAQLRSLDRKVRGLAALRGAGMVCVVVCAGVALGVLADWLFDLGVGTRVAMLIGVGAAALVAAAMAIVRPVIRRVSSAELAALVDDSFPDLRERIESTVELSDPDLPDSQKGSPFMRSQLIKETVRKTEHVDFGAAADGTSAFHWVFVAVLATLLVLLPFGLSKDGYALMLSRFLTPWRNLERASNLYFEVDQADRTVARGEDVTIKAVPYWRMSPGERPDHAWLNWQNSNGETDERRMEWSTASEAYLATLPHVFSSFDYDISADSARTRQFHISVVERPDITQLSLEVIPPAYTGRAARALDGAVGRTEVFEHSELTYDVQFNKPVESAELVWLSDDAGRDASADGDATRLRLPVTLNETQTGGRLTLPAERGGPYAIMLRDAHDLESLPTVARELILTVDTAPQISWGDLDPSRIVNIPPIEARPTDALPLLVRAVDDIGVTELSMHIEVIQRAEHLGPLVSQSPQLGQPEIAHEFDLQLGNFELRDGDLLSVRARGVDGRPEPGPQEAWSPARLIRISKDADPAGLQALMQEQQKLRNAIEEIRQEVQADREQARELENQAARDKQENKPFERQNEISELAQSERDLQQRIEQLAAVFESHPLQQTIAAETQKIADEPMRRAKEHLQQAEGADVGQQRDRLRKAIGDLSTADRQLEQLVKKFDELAALERDLQQLQQLAEHAEQLTEDVEQFEQDAQELERLTKQEALDKQQQQEQQEQLAERQLDLQDEQQDLASALDHLLEERPEIIEAARKQQIEQLQELAEQANELAKHQDRLAGAMSREPKESDKQPPAETPDPAPDSDTEQAPPGENPSAANPSENATENAPADAKQTSDESSGEPMLDQPAESQPPQDQPPQEAENAPPSLIQQQQKLADDAARQALEAARQQGTESEASRKARDFAERALKTAEEAERGLLSDAAKSANQAEQSARQTAETMKRSSEPLPERMTEQSRGLAEQQAQIAEQLKQASQSPEQRQAAEQQGQQQIARETDRLTEQLDEASQRLSSKPIDQQEAGQRAAEATQAAQQAQDAQQRAQSQLENEGPRQAAEPAREAAKSLRKSADQARQSSRQAGKPKETPVPGEVGQQVADARRQLEQAGKTLQQAGSPQQQQASNQPPAEPGEGQEGQQPGEGEEPGDQTEGEQPAEGEQDGEGQQPGKNPQSPDNTKPGESPEGDMPGENGKPGEGDGQQKPGQGKPGQKGKPSDASGSEAMRRVTESLQQAAQKMGLQKSQRSQNKGQDQQSGDSQEGADGPQGGYGARGGLSLAELEAELGRISGRNWGQLPDRVESELQLSQQKKPDGDYARLIRMYFEEVARRQSAAEGLGDAATPEAN